jgi:hypothetical protein
MTNSKLVPAVRPSYADQLDPVKPLRSGLHVTQIHISPLSNRASQVAPLCAPKGMGLFVSGISGTFAGLFTLGISIL